MDVGSSLKFSLFSGPQPSLPYFQVSIFFQLYSWHPLENFVWFYQLLNESDCHLQQVSPFLLSLVISNPTNHRRTEFSHLFLLIAYYKSIQVPFSLPFETFHQVVLLLQQIQLNGMKKFHLDRIVLNLVQKQYLVIFVL